MYLETQDIKKEEDMSLALFFIIGLYTKLTAIISKVQYSKFF